MGGTQLLATLSQDLLDLQGAARIRACEQICVRGEDVCDLPCTDLVGAFRLDQVVDPGTAAALIAVGYLHELKLRNSAKELPRSRANPLSMRSGHANDRLPNFAQIVDKTLPSGAASGF